jgi:hypothetical protein
MEDRSQSTELSESTHDAIAWLYGVLACWAVLFVLALGCFIAFVGISWEGDIALLVIIATSFIIAVNWLLIVGLKHRITICWYAAVIFLLLHLMGLLAPVAVFALIKLWKLEVQADFGLARSPRDPLPAPDDRSE